MLTLLRVSSRACEMQLPHTRQRHFATVPERSFENRLNNFWDRPNRFDGTSLICNARKIGDLSIATKIYRTLVEINDLDPKVMCEMIDVFRQLDQQNMMTVLRDSERKQIKLLPLSQRWLLRYCTGIKNEEDARLLLNTPIAAWNIIDLTEFVKMFHDQGSSEGISDVLRIIINRKIPVDSHFSVLLLRHFESHSKNSQQTKKFYESVRGNIEITSSVHFWSALITTIAAHGDRDFLKEIEDHLRSSVTPDAPLWNALIIAFQKCGLFKESIGIFRAMPHHMINDRTISCLLSTYAQEPGHLKESENLLNQLSIRNIHESMWMSLFSIGGVNTSLAFTQKVYDSWNKSNARSSHRIRGSAMNAFNKCQDIDMVLRLFQEVSKKDVDLHMGTTVLSTYALEPGHMTQAESFFDDLDHRNLLNEYSWSAMFAVCARNKDVESLNNIYQRWKSSKIRTTIPLQNSILLALGKCNMIAEARSIFETIKLEDRDSATWSAILSACAEASDLQGLKEVHDEILKSRIEIPFTLTTHLIAAYGKCGDLVTATTLFQNLSSQQREDPLTWCAYLAAVATHGDLEVVKEVHAKIITSRCIFDANLTNAILNAYIRCGDYSISQDIFSKTSREHTDAVTWTIMLNMCGLFRLTDDLEKYFQQYLASGRKVTSYVIGAVMNAYNHAIQPDKVKELYSRLPSWGLVADNKHRGIVIDALSRSGRLEEAENLLGESTDIIHCMSVLSGCRLYTDSIRGQRIAEKIRSFAPHEASNFILMANIQGKLGRWEDQESSYNWIREKGLNRIPGRSWLIFRGQKHEFVMDEKNHPLIDQIRVKNRELHDLVMKEYGYRPDLSWVSKALSEEEKIADLCKHSERSALCLGLLDESPEPLIIYKNLRVCGDCHNFTQFAAKAVQREIRLRDSSTWHIFKDGKCSCGGTY